MYDRCVVTCVKGLLLHLTGTKQTKQKPVIKTWVMEKWSLSISYRTLATVAIQTIGCMNNTHAYSHVVKQKNNVIKGTDFTSCGKSEQQVVMMVVAAKQR